jgi:DNA-binding NarL/FixJ family response regulator
MTDIHVLIADDHPIVCKGIRILLDAAMGIEVVGETVNGQQALAMVESLPPDVLLLDMQLPDMSGVEVLRKLMEKPSSVRVLSLSSHDDHAYISQMLPLGSSGYLIKDEAPKLIVDAVRGVAGGEK